MKDLALLLIHRLTTLAKLLGPGGAPKAIVADSLLMKQQLLLISRSRKRAPNLSVIDRFLLGFWSLFSIDTISGGPRLFSDHQPC